MAAETSNEGRNPVIYDVIDTSEPWKGRMLFTGPDANRDHRVFVETEHRHTGIGTMSREGTSESDYLWRAAPSTPHPRSRCRMVGEVGWGVPAMNDWNMTQTGRQVVLGEFRQECEDRHSHLYQNAWFPGPNDEIRPGTDAAMVMNVYRPKTTPSKSRSGSSRSPNRFSRSGNSRNGRSPSYKHRTSNEINVLNLRGNERPKQQESGNETDKSSTAM